MPSGQRNQYHFSIAASLYHVSNITEAWNMYTTTNNHAGKHNIQHNNATCDCANFDTELGRQCGPPSHQ